MLRVGPPQSSLASIPSTLLRCHVCRKQTVAYGLCLLAGMSETTAAAAVDKHACARRDLFEDHYKLYDVFERLAPAPLTQPIQEERKRFGFGAGECKDVDN